MRLNILLPLLIAACSLLIGCNPGNTEPEDSDKAQLDLGETGVFLNLTSNGLVNSNSFSIASQIPQETPEGAKLSINLDNLSITTTGVTTNALNTDILLMAYFSSNGVEDPCSVVSQLYFFDVVVSNGLLTEITPESATMDPTSFNYILDENFGLCFGASANQELNLTVNKLNFDFIMPGDVEVSNCAEVLALPEVKEALEQLSTNGIDFSVPEGWDVPNLEGIYTLDQDTTFDPDQTNVGDTEDGTIRLSDQTSNGIERSGFDAEIDLFVQGNASSIGFCTVARTNDRTCDQTIARIESLIVDPDTGDLTGNFLSVAVRRHAYTGNNCGKRGDFIYGTLTLTTGSQNLVTQTGKVVLNEEFKPDLLVLPNTTGNGTVTDFNSDRAIHFTTTSPFTTTDIPIPTDLASETGMSAIGISSNGERLAIVTDTPDACVTYDNDTLAVIRETATTNFDYLGDYVDFDLENTRVYLPSTHTNYADRITVLRTDTSVWADEIALLSTPSGKVPVQAQISPDGTQLAVLLEDGADIGEAGEITFINLATGGYLQPPIDLIDEAGGTALASELVYSKDGKYVFLAGLGAVLAVETSSPYDVTSIDVSNGNGDNPVAIALSNDGEVLAVAVDDLNGTADFAVVDVETLTTVHTQNLGLPERGAIDIAHFQNDRVAILANYQSFVIAVQTKSPYAVSQQLSVADDSDSLTIGRVESGGNTIAVTNTDEPAIYLFKLAAN